MPDIPDDNWSERDDRNAENAPLGFPPGLPAQIELIGQMVMGAIKRFWNKINPAYATTGTGDNYIVTPEGNTVFLNLYEIIRVRINRANTTATPTLKFGRTNARVIVKVSTTGIVPLIAGDLIAGQDHSFWFNGTNFILSNPGTVDSSVTVGLLKSANNLSDVANAATSLANIGGMAKATYDPQNINADAFARANQTGTQAQSTIVNLVSDLALKAPLASPALTGTPTSTTAAPSDNSTRIATTAYSDAASAAAILAAAITAATFTSGSLYGLTLANNATDATNDIDIAVGLANADTNNQIMQLLSGLTKRTDAAWAVGTNNGGWLDGASMPNGTGHVYLIRRPDTGVVDVGMSASLTPTLPTNYTQKRRIGSIIRSGAAILGFVQDGDSFVLKTMLNDIAAVSPGTSAVTRTLTVPVGIRVKVFGTAYNTITDNVLISDLSTTDQAVTSGVFSIANTSQGGGYFEAFTNTSSQVRSRNAVGTGTLNINTRGWIDLRGRT